MKKLTGILLFGLVLYFAGCQKDNYNNSSSTQGLFAKTEYNDDISKLSKILSKALHDHKGFRRIVKKEALIMFDGDYDILLSDFKTKTLTNSKTKSKTTVGNLLNSYYNELSNSKSPQDIIDDLTEMYPNLQISVPVHAEEWEEDYVPKVAFIPQEYQENVTEYVASYDDGQEGAIDAINPPDVPVIVVGMNERIAMLPIDGSDGPIVSINLTGITTESGIRLTWTIGENTGNPILGYRIYRKEASDSNFIYYATVYGVYNKVFDDLYVENNKSYSYYVVAFDINAETSSPSNIINITAPNNPNNLLSFDAIHLALNNTELRWENDYSEYFEGTKVYKKTVGVDNDYHLFGTYDINTHDTFDTNLIHGKRINYKAVQYSPLGVSNPKYDFVRVPYRDISQPSNLYIEKIRFDDWDIEGWLAGKPEFKLTIAGVNPSNNSSYTIQEKMIFDFCHRHSWNSFNGRLAMSWYPQNWYEILSFNLIEYDSSWGDITINFSARYKTKNEEKTGFNATAGVNYEYEIGGSDEQCGSAYLNYYDVETGWLLFPNYGARIKYSTSDINEDCEDY